MLRISDAHFRTGASHLRAGTTCQDYAKAGVALLGLPFGVVSDGCSTSGHTDVGARIWALSCAATLQYVTVQNHDFIGRVVGRAEQTMDRLGLQSSDMDATLLTVQARSDGGGRGIIFGDGALIAKYDEFTEVMIVDWVGSMPGYPSYLLDNGRRAAFINASEALAADADRAPCIVTQRLISPDGYEVESVTHQLSAAEGLEGVNFDCSTSLTFLAVASDGVQQVSGLSPVDVALQMASIPNTAGAFAQRRLNRMLATMAKTSNVPEDDISFAALVA